MSGHSHAHPHHPAEAHNASAGQGPVLVDVDDEHGALVLLTPPALEGAEIEVSRRMPDGSAGPRTHVAVLARPVGAGRVHAAVYPSLRAGRWLVHDPDADSVALAVDVPGGRVTEACWPTPAE